MLNNDIMIDDGWYVSDVTSPEKAEEAFAHLSNAAAQIQKQIDLELDKPRRCHNRLWLAKANAALRYKKAARQWVQTKKGELRKAERRAHAERRDRVLLDHIRVSVGKDQFATWLQEAGLVS